MGHNIYTSTYNEDVNKKKIQSFWDDYARKEDWQEGCTGLPKQIRWLDFVCKDEKSAEEYIKSHDRGNYDQLAVKFRSYDGMKLTPSKKYLKLKEKLNDIRNKYAEYVKAHSVKQLKAAYIGCSKCGSKLNKEYLRNDYCPLCHSDLRSKSVIESIDKYNKMIREYEQMIEEEEAAMKEKCQSNAKIMWYVKVEFHT